MTLLLTHFIVGDSGGPCPLIQSDQSTQDGGTLGKGEMGWVYVQSWDSCGFGGPRGRTVEGWIVPPKALLGSYFQLLGRGLLASAS